MNTLLFTKGSAQSLLYPILYMHVKRNIPYMGLRSIMKQWYHPYIIRDKSNEDLAYPSYIYPEVCICGAVYSSFDSLVRTSCDMCEGNGRNPISFGAFIHDFICAIQCSSNQDTLDKVNRVAIEALWAQVIYDIELKKSTEELLCVLR